MIFMSNAKPIAKNMLFIFITNIFQKIFAFIFVVFVARVLGVEQFGLYSAVTAFPLMFMTIADPGILAFLKRETAVSDLNFKENFFPAHSLKIIFSFISVLVVFIALVFLNYSFEFIFLSLIVSVSLALDSYSGLFKSVFFAKEKFQFELIISGITKSLFVLVAVYLVFLGFAVFEIIVLMLIISILNLLMCVAFFWKTYFFPFFSINIGLMKKIIFSSFLLFLLSFITILSQNLNISMLSFFYQSNLYFVGYFGAALKLISSLALITVTFNTSVFPRFTKFFNQKNDSFKSIFSKNIYYQIFLIVPIAIGCIFLSDEIIDLFFGKSFIGAGFILKILVIQTVFYFFNAAYLVSLIYSKKEKQAIPFAVIYLLINFILCFVLIPSFNAVGAAVAWLLAEYVLLILLFSLIKKHFDAPNPLNVMLKPLISGLIMALFILLTKNFISLIPLIVLSAVVYFIFAILIKAVDLKLILNLFKR
ncbi:MAG: oligosaccharide flippase family protein [Candidatus Diapherotrites archaeon]|nr:oligosaccharide flippase family protein [Candidatus Diapherotrites archaeon]